MQTKYERSIKPSELTQEIINKIEEIYLNIAYAGNMDKYIESWNRPIGTTIAVSEIMSSLKEQLCKEKNNFEDFEMKLYRENGQNPDIDMLYSKLRNDELSINNKQIAFYSNPCYGAYVDGLGKADIHLKIKYIVSQGRFYIYLENSNWYGRNISIDKKVMREWDKMITKIYYSWYINNLPVYIPNNYRQKIRKLIKS